MEAVTIGHAGGVGDGLMFSSVIKEKYCKEYDRVYIQVPRLNFLFEKLYNDTPNLQTGPCPHEYHAPHIGLKFQDGVEHSSWRDLTWDYDVNEEDRLYNELVQTHGKDYIIVHERPVDNMKRPMIRINRKHFMNPNLPVINLDGRAGHILDYRKVLQNAKEVHVYEGSFMNMADSVTNGVPLFGHLYCKPHYFDTNMVHHEIIKYIKENKWHKNNWNYIWER